MSALTADHFDDFFEAVHGQRPFSWQSDLSRSVSADRAWPDLLDVPTGGGKTALLDVALFALALDAASPVDQRWASRRVVMVVDRRIVVDQTARRAQRIVAALRESSQEVVRNVADALAGLSLSGCPARSATLRGGLVRDVGWARWPDVPLLISSTVDQVGSRLLFRGYGVSMGMRPVHAGLLGNDTLVLLDEVHLSQPFAETLRAVRDRYQDVAEKPFRNRWAVVELSGTPGSSTRHAMVVDPAASPRTPSDELLEQRFSTSKPVRLREVVTKRGVDPRTALAAAAAAEAQQILDMPGHVRRLGVVVNRVATAHAVAVRLEELFPSDRLDEHHTRVEVLTGRMRPLDRDDLVPRVTEELAAGSARRAESDRIVLVATQCIEAGADLDLDALITECASLDALRQRFGRVDRLGQLGKHGTLAPSVVLADRADVAADAEDPVYGKALSATWAWLAKKPVVDFGIQALRPPTGDALLRLLAPRPVAPLLRPGDLDRWVQTRPQPAPDPDPALWLHGLEAPPADVTVVWRADVSEETLRAELSHGQGDPPAVGSRAQDVVALLPPTMSEAVSVPVVAARRWLADGEVAPVPDVDGAEVPEEITSRTCRPFLVWRGEDSAVRAVPSSLRPGDVIVVPASYGGYSRGGWNPTCESDVPDLAHEAHIRDRGHVTLRLRAHMWPQAPAPPVSAPRGQDEDDSLDAAVAEWLDAVAGTPLSPALARAVDWIRGGGMGQKRYVVRRPFAEADWLMVTGRRPLPAPLAVDEGVETVDSEPDTSSFTAAEVALDDHLAGVGGLAGRLAEAVGLSPDLVADIELAGRLHDLGKADNRFQLMLHGGNELAAAMAPELLAKSGLAAGDVVGRRRAAQLSGYPPGMRHEMLSVVMVEGEEFLRGRAVDWHLVLHLIASHHGHARPFAPPVLDPSPRQVAHLVNGVTVGGDSGHELASLDSGVAERFWHSVRRYGWFRLAWLEAILRLADHRCSEHEQRYEEATPS